MGPVGTPEMIVIIIVALVLFGPKKLAEIGRTVGKALADFRRTSSELKATFDREMKNLEAEAGVKEVVNQYQYESYNYDYSARESVYEPAYESQSYDSTATTSTTASASATEGAESPVAVAPEGTVAQHLETAGADGVVLTAEEPLAGDGHPEVTSASTTAEHKA
jgi:TatA/E family protein of Tat protein translocase